MTTVAAFDIGIKNLAFCVMDSERKIQAWENVNILATGEEEVGPATCHKCTTKAKWTAGNTPSCKRHIPAGFKPLADQAGKAYSKVPAVSVLKTFTTVKGKRDILLADISKSWALPIEVARKRSAVHESLTTLHDGIRRCIEGRWDHFRGVGKFLLENQPVLKNPTMKSVQILLFATIRDCFLSRGLAAPEMRLVHAGKKTAGIVDDEGGDAGYATRKAGGEARAISFCTAEAADWLQTITGAKKKSDLADALCMCLDAMGST
jgi:hypothetical protein